MPVRKPDKRDYELVARILNARHPDVLIKKVSASDIRGWQESVTTEWDGVDTDAEAYVRVALLARGSLQVALVTPYDANVRVVEKIATWICAKILKEHPNWGAKVVWGSISARFGVDKAGQLDAGESGMKTWIAILHPLVGAPPTLEVPGGWVDPAINRLSTMYRVVWTLDGMAAKFAESLSE